MVGNLHHLRIAGAPPKKNAPVLLRSSQISFLRTTFTKNRSKGSVPLLATDSASSLRLQEVQLAVSNDVPHDVRILKGGTACSSISKPACVQL